MESFTDQLRRIDDANLDPYQFRLVIHYWRRGKCWESLRKTAECCGMSLGKAQETRQWLLDNGWIKWESGDGRATISLCSYSEQMQRLDRSQSEQCSPREQECSQSEQKPVEDVHVVNAILNEQHTLNEPIEIKEPPYIPPHLNLPIHLATEAMMERWSEWLWYFKERNGREMPMSTAKRQWQDFNKWGIEKSLAAMDYTMSKGYTGLVEPKENGQVIPAKPKPPEEYAIYGNNGEKIGHYRNGKTEYLPGVSIL